MKLSNKDILLIGATIAIVTLLYYYSKDNIKNKKKPSDANVGTKDQYDLIVTEFSKETPDVFTGITPEIREMGLRNFYANVSKQEADEIIEIGKKNFKDYTTEEKLKTLNFFPKILGATNVNALLQQKKQ